MSQPSVLESLEKVQFKPGEFLFHENEQSYFFFIIQEGSVEVFKTGADQKHIPLAVVGEGQALGEFAMISKKPRSASARALTKVAAVRVSEEAYQSLLNELPSWALAVIEGLVERLRQADETIRQYGIIDQGLVQKISSTGKGGG
ncbi:MAG TPA: cyclic nucleotide-binding domain-containing protein [Bdellovibrionales bacterium]|nr:cyclic nucleotide-binding domain-containing protein [Bdellovibrionales bacterium]